MSPESPDDRSTIPKVGDNRSKDDQLSEWLRTAIERHRQNKLQEAEAIYRQILGEDPTHADALHLLGVLAYQIGNDQAGIELITRAIARNRLDPFYHNNLGNIFKKLRKLPAATGCYEEALRLKPRYAEAHYNLATVLREQGDIEAATQHYHQALRITPEDVEILNDLAGALMLQGDVEGAIGCYRVALHLEPDMAELHANLGQAFEQQGNTDAAVACYEKAVELDPRHVRAHQCLVGLTTFTIDDQDKIVRLESLLNDKRLGENDTEHVHWALGKVYDDCGVFDKAFKHYKIANDCERQRKQLAFDATAYTETVSALIAVYTREFFVERQQFGSDSTLPVFVIGLSQAGKTLVESLITTHCDIHGAGGLEYFDRLIDGLAGRLHTTDAYPACVASIDSQTVNTLAEAYIEELRKHSSEAARIVNAIPNFLNLGLITLLFPKARIIHCRRDPLDVCLSIYFRSFNVSHSYAYDLTDIAHYYREYERLMDHWLRVVPDRILTVDYEDMVSNEDATRRRLIQWCALANDTKESDAGRDDRLLSTRYIGRWRNYDEFIEPLKRKLGK